MSEGEFKKRLNRLIKTMCIHAPEEDEKENITQKIHDAYRRPDKADFLKWLDEARKDFPKIGEAPNFKGELCLFLNPEKVKAWFLKWFGNAPKTIVPSVG